MKTSYALLAASLPLSVVCRSVAQPTASAKTVSRGSYTAPAWTDEPWTGDSRPYTAIRHAVDNATVRNQLSLKLAQQYAESARSKPRNPQAQFKAAYAAFRAYRTERVRVRTVAPPYQQLLQQASHALSQVPSPRTYEFYRLRFLVEASRFPDPALKQAGRRLMRANSKDAVARMGFIVIASYMPTNMGERQEVLRAAQELQRLDPKNPSYYTALGTAYGTMFDLTKNPADADNAIAAYQTYLRLAPANAPFRRIALFQVEHYQRRRNAP